ncbi:Sec-independent protein translocase protein TatA/E [Ostreococcus tauri]|uniref:Sec-independent protein translocase protein TatA/E n=1 Tax=Ostreococcus tauri TaxID=70448 RepID=A0A090M3K7_OSTTA|nr:Sec-independent protein translocase protein TatA/E [Ostreococcus tauri]CEF96594.1 Sec-independent protein translocase protein TatA/E [Ostreococcus tauri]|eukprot:XP_022838182.1 Sec-independent protein translocase protein TatA/E [Ostreococcus tauri]
MRATATSTPASLRSTTRRTHRERTVRPSRTSAPRAVAHKRDRVVVRGLFGLGLPEIVVIGGVAAVLFGPQKLPELGKSLGKTVKSFQEAAKEFKDEMQTEMEDDEEPKMIEEKKEE